jgi:hypothetical protein
MTENNGDLTPVMLTVREGRAERPTLEQAQEYVGGWIQMIRLANGDQLIVNEEGLVHRLPFNPAASAIAGQPIVGNAMLLAGEARLD